MAKKCIVSCPEFNACFEGIQNDTMWMPEGFGDEDLETLRHLALRSYDCPGPKLTEVEVVMGVLRRQIGKKQYICSHPVES